MTRYPGPHFLKLRAPHLGEIVVKDGVVSCHIIQATSEVSKRAKCVMFGSSTLKLDVYL